MVSVWICTAVALALLFYPQWEEDRIKRRRDERESEATQLELRLRFAQEFGMLLTFEEISEAVHEWSSWRSRGRGEPYG